MAEISSIPMLALIQEQGLVDDLQLEEVVQEHTRSGKPAAIDEVGYLTGKEIQVVVADPTQIEKAISKHYGEENESISDILKELGADADIAREVAEAASGDGATDLENLANETPIIKFV